MNDKGKPLTPQQRDAIRNLLENYSISITRSFAGKEGPGYYADLFFKNQLFGFIVDEGNGDKPRLEKSNRADSEEVAEKCLKEFNSEVFKTPAMPEYKCVHTPQHLVLEAIVRVAAVKKKANKNPTSTYVIPLDSGWLDSTVVVPIPNFNKDEVEKSLREAGHEHYIIISPTLSSEQYRTARKIIAVKRQRELMRDRKVVVLTKDDKLGVIQSSNAWDNPAIILAAHPGAYIPLLDEEQSF